MHFLHPEMLLVLGLIPILLVIHALRPRPRPVDTTTLFLWQEVLKERGRSLTLDRLKKNLPLLLQILMVILAAIALARPVRLTLASHQGNMILILDTSASMQTKQESGIRFDVAREKALDLIARRAASQKILLLEASSDPKILSGFSDDSDRLTSLVRDLAPTDAPGKIANAVYMALSFLDPARDDTMYLITDGAGSHLEDLLQLHPNIFPILIPGGEKNLGITRFEFRQELERQDRYQIMLEVKNFTAEATICPVQISIDHTVIHEARLLLAPFEKITLFFPYSGLISGIAKAELEIEDDLPVDNIAYLALSASQDIWVLLVSPGNYFLETVLKSYPNVLVNSIKEIHPSSWQEQTMRHDLVIIDRMDFPQTRKGNLLLIDAYSTSIPVKKEGALDFPQILAWDQTSPLMAGVNLGGLLIERAAVLDADESAHPVLEAPQTGLIYAYETDELRAVTLGFDLTRSNLPLKVAFPVMMSNIINWLNPQKLAFSVLYAKAGEPYQIQLSPQTTRLAIRRPGEKWKTSQIRSNPFTYTETGTVGIYTIAENKKTRYFTVNLVDEAESDIRVPSIDVSLRTAAPHAERAQVPVQQPLWRLFFVTLVAIALLEWYIWLHTG